MSDKIYKNDTGVLLKIDMQEDISDTTVTDLLVYKGEGSIATWSAEIYNSNYLSYLVSNNDLNEIGIYYVQPSITKGSKTVLGKTVSFEVFDVWR